jgi:hypothetical protein
MPIIKGYKDTICFKCNIHTDNFRVWSFNSPNEKHVKYYYILCQFCTVRCDICRDDVVSTGANFMTISVIKDMSIIHCQKCIDRQINIINKKISKSSVCT